MKLRIDYLAIYGVRRKGVLDGGKLVVNVVVKVVVKCVRWW